MIQLRPIHLLCIEKYHKNSLHSIKNDDPDKEIKRRDFIENVKQIYSYFTDNAFEKVQLVSGFDAVCHSCGDEIKTICANDFKNGNTVKTKKDKEILKKLNLIENQIYDVDFLLDVFGKNFEERELFKDLHCENCQFNEQCHLYLSVVPSCEILN